MTGAARAVFGDVRAEEIHAWLSRHVRARLGVDVSEVLAAELKAAASVTGIQAATSRVSGVRGPPA